MLLSPPSPPSPYRFSPQPPTQPTASSSTRSLSVITVPTSSYPSLQNYSYSPASGSSLPRSDPSPNSKTSAFFGSPFESPSSLPSSNSSQSVSKTSAFFSSPFADFPTPPPNQQTTPREVPSSSRSLTADFFSSTPFSSCPTSPPSLRSSTSSSSLRTSPSQAPSPAHYSTALPPDQTEDNDATPVPKPRMPLLSRLFPSRFSSNVRRTDDDRLSTQRDFVDLEPPEDVLVASPSTLESPSIAIVAPPVESYAAGALVHPYNEDELSYRLVRQVGHGAFSLVWLAHVEKGRSEGTLVAVKMIARAGEQNDGAARRVARGERVSFMREVEVLHYLTPTHASLPRLYASFTVRTHHVLVLEYVSGGELLDVVNSDEQHAQLSESLLRRIFRELVSAVEWIHAHFVVHRDIKLENILLTANPFVSLPTEDQPLVKLTDFGLSRKIDPDDPWLSTRCGSESYAAPELLVAAHSTTTDAESPLPSLSRAPSDAHGSSSSAYSASKQPRARTPGMYDGRETDAWALGVVLFALATRALPFDPPLMLDAPPADADEERARRRWVLRVVRGEWTWPAAAAPVGEEGEARGAQLVRLVGVRDVVARLLVCDPRRRARVGALWDEPWMRQGEAVVP
ncbi:kinase-like domain-containing protein [Lactarius sanguifluus]|nr:kinase-like domain-containing protein [Lactarius sanguifluus]KAH9171146.1 kinase-like domain-containing protein [Lactarius sanguifluus]